MINVGNRRKCREIQFEARRITSERCEKMEESKSQNGLRLGKEFGAVWKKRGEHFGGRSMGVTERVEERGVVRYLLHYK